MANNKEQERITYIRQNINPTYKLSQADALTYAAKMGALDSYHGISQFIGDTFGIDDAVEELKAKDRTLQAILESEEYGGKAMGAFLASAVVADPIGWLPIVGWVQKGKKAKTLYDFTKYGAIAGGFHGSVGYVSEESPGLIGDKQSRIENMAIGSGAGTILGALGGTGLNAIRKYKGRKSATKTDEVEVLEPPSDKPVKEAKFVRNEDGTYWARGKSNQYQRTTYQINKNKNGTWTVNKVDEKRPPTEYLVPTELSKFEPNIQKIGVVKTLKQAKQIVNGKVAPKSKLDVKAKIQEEQTKQPTVDPKKIADEVSAERITKEIVEEAEGKPSYKDTVLKQYQDMFGHAIKQKVFDNWGTSLMGVGGGISGYHSVDPDATFMEKMGTAMLVGASLATGTRFAGKIKYGDEVLGDAISRQIVDLYGLSDDYKALRKNLQVNKNKIGNRFLEIAKEASEKLEKDELKLLYNFMTGNAKGIDNLSEEAIKIGKEGRELITEMGQKYVDLGLLNPETFKKNVATYLHRTYTKHLNFPEKGIKVDKENAKNFMGAIKEFTIIGDNLKSRGIHRNYAKKSWQKKKSKLVKEGWYIEKEAKGRVHIRRDFTKEEREVRGEIEDAAFAIAETGRLMSNDLSIAKFFDDIATAVDDEGNKLYALTKDEWEAFGNPADFIQLSNKTIRGTKQKAFGTLAGDEKAMSPQQYRKQRKTLEAQGYKVVGKNKKSVYLAKEAMYVHKDVEKDIRRMIPLSNENKIAEDIEKSFTGLQTLWKLSKTAWNPAVHINNIMSNMLFLDFADTEYKYLFKAIKEFRLGAKGKSEVYRLAKEQGVFDSDLVTKELRSHLGTSVDQALHKITSADAPGDFFGYGAKLYKAMRSTKQATLGKLEDAYQYEDQIFRMAVFMDRLDKKNNISTAASEARKWFIDYDISAPWVNTLRRTATPFLSYTYRVVPLLAEAAILRPHKFAKWAVVGAIINAASNKLTNDGEEVERITMREELNKTLWDVPGMPPTMLKLPWKSNEGDSQYLDISRWSPGGDIFESREEGVPFLPTPLQPSFGIYGDFYNTVIARKDTFTGQEVENLGLGEWEDTKTLMKALGTKLIPNVPIIPGSFAYKKIQKALRQEAPNEHALFEKTIRKFYNAEEQQLEGSPYSGKYSPLEAFLYSLGVKLRPQSIEANRNLKDFEYNTKLNDAHKVVTKAEKEYANGTISYEEKEALIKESEARVLELVAHYDKYSDKFDEASIDREERRQSNVTGGLIEGEGEVPYVKEKPEERINPFTGESYTALYYRGGAVRKQYDEGGSDDKKVSDMERLGFAKAGKLDIVKEDIEKEESRLDAELQIRQSEGSSNRGLNNRNLGNLYAGSFNKDEQKIIYNPKVISYHGVTGIDSKGVGEKSPEVYVKFGKWVHGLRAMAHTLRKPQYRNKNLEEITNTYSRTDKDSYSNNVSSLSGNILKVGEPIDTHNDEKLRLLMKSMLINEVGHGMSPNNLLIDEAIKLSKNSMKDSEVYKTMYPKVDLTNSPPPL
jgi:hypothetical protein